MEFIQQGRLASGGTKVINLSGGKNDVGYRLKEFKLWGSTNLGATSQECWGTLVRSNTAVSPINPDFGNEALVGVATFHCHTSPAYPPQQLAMFNDLVDLVADCILMVQDSSDGEDINYLLKFEEVKLSDAAISAANYSAAMIRKES